MKKIVIIGASPYVEIILDCIQQEGKYTVVGFIDSSITQGLEPNPSFPILGKLNDLPELIEKHNLMGGIIAVENNKNRKNIADHVNLLIPDFEFVITIHPSAELGDDIYIGTGTAVLKGARIESNSWVGDFCMLSTKATLGDNGIMDDFSSLAAGVHTGADVGVAQFTNMVKSVVPKGGNNKKSSLSIADLGYHAIGFGKRLKINL